MRPVAISADGKSAGKLCSLAIDLNASKQIAPQAAASAGVPCRRITFIASPFWRFDWHFVPEHHGTAHARVSALVLDGRSADYRGLAEGWKKETTDADTRRK